MNARDHSNRIAALLRKEQSAMADFLRALADFDAKKLWRELGHGSLFQYLRLELRLSAGAAQHRKTAVELIQSVPEVEAALGDGRLCLSSIIELAKVLTPENVCDVLPRFFGLSRREAEALAVTIRPAPVVPRREVLMPLAPSLSPRSGGRDGDGGVRIPVPSTATDRRVAADEDATLQLQPGEPPGRTDVAPPPAAPVPPRDSERPLDAERSRLSITVSREFVAKLKQTKDALSHSHPGASTEEILIACMDLMLAKKAKQKAGIVAKPLETPRPSRTAHVPAHVRREVWARAGGRCEWVFPSGERCSCTTRLEYDHLVPVALGGVATIETIRLACREHNILAARRVFGDAWMDRFTRGRNCAAGAPATG